MSMVLGGIGMLKDIIEAERDQNADCARIGAAIHLAEQDIADPGELAT